MRKQLTVLVLILLVSIGSASHAGSDDLVEEAERNYWGIGLDLDLDKAEELLLKAQERGDSLPLYYCDAFYNAIGVKQNLKAAFECYRQNDDKTLLAMMTANGEGTKRDIDKALSLLDDDSLFKTEIQNQKAKENNEKLISFCESATSTEDMRRCIGIDVQKQSFQHRLDMKAFAKAQLDETQAALKAFHDAHTRLQDSECEARCLPEKGGTSWLLSMDSCGLSLGKDFNDDVRAITHPDLEKSQKAKDYHLADKKLNTSYATLAKVLSQCTGSEQLNTKELIYSVKKTQLNWLSYRDTGQALFLKKTHAQSPAWSWLVYATQRRSQKLDELTKQYQQSTGCARPNRFQRLD